MGGFVGLAVIAYWSWSTLARVSRLPQGETLIVAPVEEDAGFAAAFNTDDELSAPLPRDVEIAVRPHKPAPPSAWRPTVGVETLIRPLAATRSEPPGWRRDEPTGHWYYEPALRLHAPAGSDVQAALPGVVVEVEPTSGGGLKVALQHEGGLRTVYENLYDVPVAVGNAVSGYARLGRLANAPAAADRDASLLFAVYQENDALDVASLLEQY